MFLERSVRNVCQAAKAPCGPEANGSCAFAINVCTERMQKTSPPKGSKGRETHRKSPSAYSENEQDAVGENVGSSDIIQRQARDLTPTETRVQKEEGEKFLVENSFSDDHNPYPTPVLG